MAALKTDPEDSKDYLHRLEFEHELINRRLTWLLSSQAIMFAAYGITLDGNAVSDAESFRGIIALMGLLTSLLLWVGVLAGLRAKNRLWRDYQDKFHLRVPWGVRTAITWWGLVPDVSLPLLFVAGWAALL